MKCMEWVGQDLNVLLQNIMSLTILTCNRSEKGFEEMLCMEQLGSAWSLDSSLLEVLRGLCMWCQGFVLGLATCRAKALTPVLSL